MARIYNDITETIGNTPLVATQPHREEARRARGHSPQAGVL